MIYKILIITVFLMIQLLNTLYANENIRIDLAYPPNNATINANSTFFIGNTSNSKEFFINDKPVKLYDKGIFVYVVNLKSGKNLFKLKSVSETNSISREMSINVPYPQSQVPSNVLTISTNSLIPSGKLIYSTGEMVNFMFKSAPGLKASIKIANKIFPALELPPYIDNVKNLVLGEVYGVRQNALKGYYNAVIQMDQIDNLKDSSLKIVLSNNKGKSKTLNANVKLTAWNPKKDPKIAQIIVNNATIRTGPTESRLSPLPIGVKILLSGFENGTYRFKMGPFLDAYIKEKDIKILPKGTPIPFSKIRNFKVKVIKDSTYIIIPVTNRLPFNINQSVDQKILTLFVYGAKADTDIIRYDLNGSCIEQVKWNQPYTNVYQLDILMKNDHQWGYDIYYTGYENKGTLGLVLKIKNPPLINKLNPLKNKIIVIDPGHGGSELGSVGPGLVPEKDVNFSISSKLFTLLKNNGAIPILTRKEDVYMALSDRTAFAKAKQADVFLSIHNNALPDGRNPLTEHGSSTYYYHPMAFELAKSIQKSFLKNLNLPDFGLYYDNLAITREYSSPSVLVEVGFMIHPEEYLSLTNEAFQNKAALAIQEGISDFFMNRT